MDNRTGSEDGSDCLHGALLQALAANRHLYQHKADAPSCWRADKAPGQLQLRRKPASRPSLNSLQGAFEALDVAGDGGRGGVS